MELAPGLFSTTMVQPVCSCTFCRTIRVALSVMPPGGYGTIHRIGLAGHAVPWACNAVEPSRMSAASASLNSCMVVLLRVVLVQVLDRTAVGKASRYKPSRHDRGGQTLPGFVQRRAIVTATK